MHTLETSSSDMKLPWAVLFLVFQAADFQAQSAGNVACLNERQDSCSHCPQLFAGGNRLDFDHCAGDCQIGLTGRSQNCVPKGSYKESQFTYHVFFISCELWPDKGVRLQQVSLPSQ